MKASKGSAFEREICKKLSLWWTKYSDQPREDIFWRTAGSGARAKVRGRKNKKTAGQHGDIAAIDPIGKPFIDLLTLELKRGYNKSTIADLLDKPAKAAKQVYEKWFEQAKESAEQAKSVSWALIVKHNQREPIIFMPHEFIEWMGWDEWPTLPQLYLDCEQGCICGVLLSDFLEQAFPEDIEAFIEKR